MVFACICACNAPCPWIRQQQYEHYYSNWQWLSLGSTGLLKPKPGRFLMEFSTDHFIWKIIAFLAKFSERFSFSERTIGLKRRFSFQREIHFFECLIFNWYSWRYLQSYFISIANAITQNKLIWFSDRPQNEMILKSKMISRIEIWEFELCISINWI